MIPLLGPLVSAGASLIGGLFSMGSEKKRDKANAAAQAAANAANEARVNTMNADVRARAARAASVPILTQQSGDVDVAAMLQGAEDAGINPLTWLQSGGMQAYARSSTAVFNSQLMDAALAGSSIFQESAPPMQTARGAGEVIGSALVTGAGQWVADANQERQNQFQMAMLQAQLDGQNRSGSGYGRSGYVPTAFLSGPNVKTSRNSAVLANNTTTIDGVVYPNVWVSAVDENGKIIRVPNMDVIGDAESLGTILAGQGGVGTPSRKGSERTWLDWSLAEWGQKAGELGAWLGGTQGHVNPAPTIYRGTSKVAP